MQVIGAERLRQEFGHGLDPCRSVDEAAGPTMLPEQLSAPAAGHQHRTLPIDAGERQQPPAAAGMERGDQPAFRA
jgi:hypothetical protein